MSQLSAPPTVWKDVLSHRKFSAMEERAMALRGEHDQSLPVTHINIFGSLKSAFKCLERNEILGIAADGGGGKERIALEFLGRKAWFSPGAARIALATRSTVLPTFVLRDGRGKNTLVIEPPLSLPCSGDLDLDSAALMQDFAHILERYVQDYKDHYLNFLALREYMTTQGDRAFIDPVGPV
jgi:KDO2-lipid IV(A) lauroyltransferase